MAAVGSSFYGELWADQASKMALDESQFLHSKYVNAELSNSFPDTSLGKQFKAIAKMMNIHVARGVERDVFYAEMLGVDSHSNINTYLPRDFDEINNALLSMSTEMKAQDKWNNVTFVFVSEFARTLSANTANGTDHAWGGNYFIAGGSVDGGKILGKYPSDLTKNSPVVVEPGIVIPTLPWESVWNGVAEWFGITDDAGLLEVLPNSDAFDGLFGKDTLYVNDSSVDDSKCADSPLNILVEDVSRNCTWVAEQPQVQWRCPMYGIQSHCPSSCNSTDCTQTQDSLKLFQLDVGLWGSCVWVRSEDTANRCQQPGVRETCRETCAGIPTP